MNKAEVAVSGEMHVKPAILKFTNVKIFRKGPDRLLRPCGAHAKGPCWVPCLFVPAKE